MAFGRFRFELIGGLSRFEGTDAFDVELVDYH
jgi:hypothetical protein